MIREKSCGAVIYTMVNGERYYLIERMKAGHHSLCKGHVENGETEEETALREIREETGLIPTLDTGFRTVIEYSPYPGCMKEVVFFLACAPDRFVRPQPEEVEALRWLPFREAAELLTYADDRDVLTKAEYYLRNADGSEEKFDCCFTRQNQWFRYRAGAIIVENECVLFAGNEQEDYLYSIGGGVHMGETAEDAVCREVFEETGIRYEIDRLAVIHENFFDENAGLLRGYNCHEISFYYLMKPRGSQQLCSHSTTHGVPEKMHWIPVKDLGKYKAFPSFIREYLSKPHTGIAHIVTDERHPEKEIEKM